ncbi:Hypothetical_protein [Hexamita inflata]|uniref:Hypothetical_protein n=1 Tax=Hexamita inflata TaxID=28002 RepID=A0AA86UHI2_9EUKA|nr:Hypothetical protein HINF_LOCUS46050 [Hexamita inflata]
MNEFPQALQLNQFDSNTTRLFKLCLYIINTTDLKEIIRLCQQIVDILKYIPVKNSVELLHELNFYILHPDYLVKREIAKLLLNVLDFVCAEQQMQIICPLSFVHSPDRAYVQQIVQQNLNKISVQFPNYKFKPTIRLWYYFLQFELQMIGPELILNELIVQIAGGAEMQLIEQFNVPVNLLRPVQMPKYAVQSSEQFLFSVKLRKLFKDEEDQQFVDGLSELKSEDVFNHFRLQNDQVSVYSTQPVDLFSISQSNLQQFVVDATSGVVLKYKIIINTLDFLIINALHSKELFKTVLQVILQKRAVNFKQELSITTYVKFDKRVLLAQKSFEKIRLKFNLDQKALQKVAKSDHKDVVRVGKQELMNQTKSIQETEASINAQLDTIKQKINSIQKKMDTANINVNTIKQQKVVFKEIKIKPEKIEQIKQKAKRTALDEKIREAFAPSQKDKDKDKDDKDKEKEKGDKDDKDDKENKENDNKENENKEDEKKEKTDEKETKKEDKQENKTEKEKKQIKTDIKINKEGAKKKINVFSKLNQVFTKKDKEEPKETKTVEKEETKTNEKVKEEENKQKEEEPGMSLDLSAQQVTTTLSLKKEELEKAQEEAKKIANLPEKLEQGVNKEQPKNDMDLDEPKIEEPKVEEPIEQVKQENEIKPANQTEADENNINAQNEQQISTEPKAEPAQIITQNKENGDKETEFLLQHDQNAQKEPERKQEEK